MKELSSKVLQGNLDPCQLYAPQDEIERAASTMCETFKNHRHIANLGHGIYPDTNPEHLKTYIDTVHKCTQTDQKSAST